MLSRYFSLIFVILISACGGSSSNSGSTGDNSSNSANSDSVTSNAILTGQVVDAINASPIPGVSVSADGFSPGAITGSDGRFELGSFLQDDVIDLRFALDGYLPELYAQPSLGDPINQLDIVRLIPNDNIGTGSIGGTISNTQGDSLAGVLLRFFAGINVIEGTAVATATSNSAGRWSIASLEAGNYTCIILVDGQEPIFETVQILGGINNGDADFIAPMSSTVPSTDIAQIDFPDNRSHRDYGPEEVTWSYDMYSYEATSGSYSVDRRDRTGTNQLLHFIGPDINPLNWRDSTVNIIHSFTGPGVYPVLDSNDKLLEAAEAGQPAAFVFIVASGPKGTIGFARLERYVTTYDPAGGGTVSVAVDNEGRYRFDISDLAMIPSRFNRPDFAHPDAPELIRLNLSNGYVP